MASLSAREINQVAARTGIGRQYILKEMHVFDIWGKICLALTSKEIADHAKVICKGGTPLNKVFLGRVQRFSEDLDMDIFFKRRLEREEKIKFLKDKIIPIVSDSYSVPKEARKKNVILFFCKFKNDLGMDDNVQLEFNIGEIQTGINMIGTAKSSILPLKLENVPVYSFETLVAKKIKAFYEREEGKDVYDMYYSLKSKCDMTKVVQILQDVLRSAKINYAEFKKEFPNKLADSNNMKRLHASTNPYIPKNLRIDFIKASAFISKKVIPHLK